MIRTLRRRTLARSSPSDDATSRVSSLRAKPGGLRGRCVVAWNASLRLARRAGASASEGGGAEKVLAGTLTMISSDGRAHDPSPRATPSKPFSAESVLGFQHGVRRLRRRIQHGERDPPGSLRSVTLSDAPCLRGAARSTSCTSARSPERAHVLAQLGPTQRLHTRHRDETPAEHRPGASDTESAVQTASRAGFTLSCLLVSRTRSMASTSRHEGVTRHGLAYPGRTGAR